MSNRDFATTLAKLVGVALIVYAILGAASYAPYLVAAPELLPILDVVSLFVSKVGGPMLIGMGLFYFGGTLIGRHIPDTDISSEAVDSLERTGLSLMGVFLFYMAASDMVVHLSSLYKINAMIKSGAPTSYASQMDVDTFAAMVATLFEMVVSLWLIFGASGMVNLFNRIRGR